MRNRCAWHVWLHCREFLIYPEIFHRWTARDIKASVVDMADDRPIRCQWGGRVARDGASGRTLPALDVQQRKWVDARKMRRA